MKWDKLSICLSLLELMQILRKHNFYLFQDTLLDVLSYNVCKITELALKLIPQSPTMDCKNHLSCSTNTTIHPTAIDCLVIRRGCCDRLQIN